jgi:hypothetical protein
MRRNLSRQFGSGHRELRVAQIGDVAQVAPALRDALNGRAAVTLYPLPQRGASRRDWAKIAAFPVRIADAMRVAARVRGDVAHIHWLPNGVVGAMLRMPWVLHVHGSDIRGVDAPRSALARRILRWPDAVVVSTPDLLESIPSATWLPTPIPRLHIDSDARYDVLVNSTAHKSKGSEIAFQALRLVHSADPSLRLAAMDGPAFEPGPWERIQPLPKPKFHALLASSRVVLGQFAAGALGIADLETLALDRPLVTWVKSNLYPTPPPIMNARSPDEVAAAALAPSELRGAQWVSEFHDPPRVADMLIQIYERLITSAT